MAVADVIEYIAKNLINNLHELNIDAYIYHESETSNSMYIRFKDARIGSVRISDHSSKKYSYKYEIRTDLEYDGKWLKTDGKWQFFINARKWKKMIPILQERSEFVQKWKPREYYTPEHKKNK